jgi:hypothetical protein
MDDLRQWTLRGAVQDSIPIYLNSETMDVIERAFPYMVDQTKATGGGAVPSLEFHVYDKDRQGDEMLQEFWIEELKVTPFEGLP